MDSWLGCGLLCMCVDGEYNSCEGEGEREREREREREGGGGIEMSVYEFVC